MHKENSADPVDTHRQNSADSVDTHKENSADSVDMQSECTERIVQTLHSENDNLV